MPIEVSRILHAGYVFKSQSVEIAFDPIFQNPFSRNCHAFPDVQFDSQAIRRLRFAAVFISHYHDDHCSMESLNLLDRRTPIYLFCVFDEMFDMIRSLGFEKVYSLQLNEPVFVGPFEVIARRALDADVDCLFQIRTEGLNILNVVDSWIDPETMRKLESEKPWDLVLWPFQTMRELEVIAPTRFPSAPPSLPQEWMEQLQMLNPRFIVPSSCQFLLEKWSWYNQTFFPISYRQFQNEVESRLKRSCVRRMNPSTTMVLDSQNFQMGPALDWIQIVGDPNVDYDFQINLRPPPTAEISKHFAPLSDIQARTVDQYCRQGLLEKYRSMDESMDPYFEKKRIWKLVVYDHQGNAIEYLYRLAGRSIEILSTPAGPVAWLTEVPVSKLYAALEQGESLTSMYMRINDCQFDLEIENEICDADIVEDPLIRCLFTGVFGAYQAAELRRLQEPV